MTPRLRFHHIGVACQKLETAADFVSSTLAVRKDSGPIVDDLQQATLRLFDISDDVRVELVSGAMVRNVARNGPQTYHICFEVRDLEAAIAEMTREGSLLFSPPKPAVLFAGRRVAFLMTPLGLTELLEER